MLIDFESQMAGKEPQRLIDPGASETPQISRDPLFRFIRVENDSQKS